MPPSNSLDFKWIWIQPLIDPVDIYHAYSIILREDITKGSLHGLPKKTSLAKLFYWEVVCGRILTINNLRETWKEYCERVLHVQRGRRDRNSFVTVL